MPISIAGRSRTNSRQATRRRRRHAVVVAANASVALTSGTANVSGKKCASAGTETIEPPKPVAPKIV